MFSGDCFGVIKFISRFEYIRDYSQFEENAEITIATVIEKGIAAPKILNGMRLFSFENNDIGYGIKPTPKIFMYIQYEFKDNMGREHKSKEIINDTIYSRVNKGDKITILYDSSKPENAMILRVRGSSVDVNIITIPVVCGLLLVFIGYVLSCDIF